MARIDQQLEPMPLLAIGVLQVIEIRAVRQCVLRQHVKRIRIRMRLDERRGQTASGIGAAKINAAGRNAVDDLVHRELSVLGIAIGDVFVRQADFEHWTPITRAQTNVRRDSRPALVLRMTRMESVGALVHIRHCPPIAFCRRVEEPLKLR